MRIDKKMAIMLCSALITIALVLIPGFLFKKELVPFLAKSWTFYDSKAKAASSEFLALKAKSLSGFAGSSNSANKGAATANGPQVLGLIKVKSTVANIRTTPQNLSNHSNVHAQVKQGTQFPYYGTTVTAGTTWYKLYDKTANQYYWISGITVEKVQ